jgi:4-hydroxybenzoate polyprenyltransferase
MLLALFRLIRLVNLAIVVIAQYLVYGLLLLPPFRQAGISPALDGLHFSLLVLVTVLITAGGYIINDIIDAPGDQANRPERWVVGRTISQRQAYQWYWGSNILGLALALYLAWQVGNIFLAGLHPLAVGLLYLYSAYLKRQVLSGNFLVSLFCAGVAGIVWFAERAGFAALCQELPERAGQAGWAITWYMVFAFLATMFREIVKDMEDAPGDASTDCRTLPLQWGIPAARGIAASFGLGLLFFLLYLPFSQPAFFEARGLAYLAALVVLPLLAALILLLRAQDKPDFHLVSQLAKLIMLSGLGMLFFLA